MKYINTIMSSIISLSDNKEVYNAKFPNKFSILKTDDIDIIKKLESGKYTLKINVLEQLIDCKFKDYLKSNPIKDITEPLYSSYKEIFDDEGNILKIGEGDILLSISDLKLNAEVNLKLEMLNDFEIEVTQNNFNEYFEEKPKTEIEKLNEEILSLKEENANLKNILNNGFNDISIAMADLIGM